jgi:hypothetical protein
MREAIEKARATSALADFLARGSVGYEFAGSLLYRSSTGKTIVDQDFTAR